MNVENTGSLDSYSHQQVCKIAAEADADWRTVRSELEAMMRGEPAVNRVRERIRRTIERLNSDGR